MPKKRKNRSSGPSGAPQAKKARPSLDRGDLSTTSPPSSPPNAAPPQPRNDPVYGQKHAFPGLDDEFAAGGELFYGPPEDGMEYLRMVRPWARLVFLGNLRSETNNLPVVFIAQDVSVTSDGNYSSVRHRLDIEDGKSTAESRHEGTYSDGAYIAPRIEEAEANPSSTSAEWEQQEGDERQDPEVDKPDAQEMYYNLLHHRFVLLRSTLKCTPPSSAIAALDADHPISLPGNARKARFEWRNLLRKTDPQMTQLACMDAESVLRVIAILTRSLSEAAQSEDAERVKRLGAWAWGLLGKCREAGQMGSEGVAELRDLGKRAVKILVKLRSPEIRQALEEASREGDGTIEDSGAEDEESDQEDPDHQDQKRQNASECDTGGSLVVETDKNEEASELEIAKARLQRRLEIEPADDGDNEGSQQSKENVGLKQQIFAMLDMIISVVGEFYGQRDLLEFRDIWNEVKE